MYLRVDPSKSAGNDLFVMEKNAEYDKLKSRVQIDCLAGGHYTLPTAILIEHQEVKCVQTGSDIYTLIYKI
jgi:hypothetical protein